MAQHDSARTPGTGQRRGACEEPTVNDIVTNQQFWPNYHLVGGFKPVEKYWSNWIISPSRVLNKKYLKTPPRKYFTNLDFPEIAGDFQTATFWGAQNSWGLGRERKIRPEQFTNPNGDGATPMYWLIKAPY